MRKDQTHPPGRPPPMSHGFTHSAQPTCAFRSTSGKPHEDILVELCLKEGYTKGKGVLSSVTGLQLPPKLITASHVIHEPASSSWQSGRGVLPHASHPALAPNYFTESSFPITHTLIKAAVLHCLSSFDSGGMPTDPPLTERITP